MGNAYPTSLLGVAPALEVHAVAPVSVDFGAQLRPAADSPAWMRPFITQSTTFNKQGKTFKARLGSEANCSPG